MRYIVSATLGFIFAIVGFSAITYAQSATTKNPHYSSAIQVRGEVQNIQSSTITLKSEGDDAYNEILLSYGSNTEWFLFTFSSQEDILLSQTGVFSSPQELQIGDMVHVSGSVSLNQGTPQAKRIFIQRNTHEL